MAPGLMNIVMMKIKCADKKIYDHVYEDMRYDLKIKYGRGKKSKNLIFVIYWRRT